MRVMLLFPLTYLSGVHGFALFSPMLLMVLVMAHLRGRHRRSMGRSPVRAIATATPLLIGNFITDEDLSEAALS